MTNKLKEILEEFDNKYSNVGVENIGYVSKELREFLKSSLLQYAHSVIPAIDDSSYTHKETRDKSSGYNTCIYRIVQQIYKDEQNLDQ